MKKQTILITGGSAGIGFEIAKLFSEKGHHVIITGRNKDRLESAAEKLQHVTAIACDVTLEKDVDALVDIIHKDFPNLSMLINNAGSAFYYKLYPGANAFEKASQEILTNYLSIISLTEKLLPTLAMQPEGAVVNVSSIVAFVPSHRLATYAASKAALHSYTKSLRITLEQSTNIKVYELMPPLVNTDFSKEIGGENGIPASEVAQALYDAMESNTYEIHVGGTAQMYDLYRQSPADALLAMNAER
ncbi:SDR family oxidoreductase [Chitinophagaceae bacterium MMS25-I14]